VLAVGIIRFFVLNCKKTLTALFTVSNRNRSFSHHLVSLSQYFWSQQQRRSLVVVRICPDQEGGYLQAVLLLQGEGEGRDGGRECVCVREREIERGRERKSGEGGRVFWVLEGFCKNGDGDVACEGKGKLAAAAAVWI
jgi:hypothetical protein